MGRRGPKPLPTSILEKRGSWRAKSNRNEPVPPPGPPECPEWLDEDAKALWAEVTPLLIYMRLLTKADRQAMTRYCLFWSRWRQAEMFIQKFGESYPVKDDKGRIKCFMPWPQVAIANRLAQQLLRLEQEFGMTPSARSRLDLRKVVELTPEEQERKAAAHRFLFCEGGIRPVPPGVLRASG